jgi:hypothetical protein
VAVKRRLCIFLSFLFLVALACRAQSQNQPFDSAESLMQQEGFMPEEIPDKNEPPAVTLRPMLADSSNAIKQQKEYAYMKYIDSVLRAKKAAALAEQQKAKPKQQRIGWLRGMLWGLAIAALLFIIYQIVAGRIQQQRPEEYKKEAQPTPSEIENAIQRREYRLATRLLFLDSLQLMAGKGYLHLMQEKTNYQYLNEIEDEGRKTAFATCLMHYEYTWYGEFMPNENQFHSIHQSFVTFREKWL